jgi:hypothetical protein
LSPVTSQWEGLSRHHRGGRRRVDWPVTVAVALLAGEGVSCIVHIRHTTNGIHEHTYIIKIVLLI